MRSWRDNTQLVVLASAAQSLLELYCEHLRLELPLAPPPASRHDGGGSKVVAYAPFTRQHRRRFESAGARGEPFQFDR